jgi:hypothetical protein
MDVYHMNSNPNLYAVIGFLTWIAVVTFATLPVHRYLESLKAKNARGKRLNRMFQVLYYTALVV